MTNQGIKSTHYSYRTYTYLKHELSFVVEKKKTIHHYASNVQASWLDDVVCLCIVREFIRTTYLTYIYFARNQNGEEYAAAHHAKQKNRNKKPFIERKCCKVQGCAEPDVPMHHLYVWMHGYRFINCSGNLSCYGICV